MKNIKKNLLLIDKIDEIQERVAIREYMSTRKVEALDSFYRKEIDNLYKDLPLTSISPDDITQEYLLVSLDVIKVLEPKRVPGYQKSIRTKMRSKAKAMLMSDMGLSNVDLSADEESIVLSEGMHSLVYEGAQINYDLAWDICTDLGMTSRFSKEDTIFTWWTYQKVILQYLALHQSLTAVEFHHGLQVETESTNPEDLLIIAEDEQLLNDVLDSTLANLRDRDRLAISERLIPDEPKTFGELREAFGVTSKSRVSQIYLGALRRLRGKFYNELRDRELVINKQLNCLKSVPRYEVTFIPQ